MERSCGETATTINYADWQFGGCTIFAGNLYVSTSDATADLLPLQGLKSINGSLTIYFSVELKRLNGLESLESVGGRFLLMTNRELVDLTALSSLQTASKIAISTNPKLETLDGLSRLTTIDELEISDNVSLRSLAGLSNLRHIRGGLYISGNTSLPKSEVTALLARVQVDGVVSTR